MSAQSVDTVIDADVFRGVFRRHAAGVAIITVTGTQGPAGCTVTSLTSISLEPPLLSIAISSSASVWPALEAADGFVVNFLGDDADDLAGRFATRGADRFGPATRWRDLPSGEPLLLDAAGWLRCRVAERIRVGDHYLVVGLALDGALARDASPLLYHDGAYRTIASLPVAAGPVAALP